MKEAKFEQLMEIINVEHGIYMFPERIAQRHDENGRTTASIIVWHAFDPERVDGRSKCGAADFSDVEVPRRMPREAKVLCYACRDQFSEGALERWMEKITAILEKFPRGSSYQPQRGYRPSPE